MESFDKNIAAMGPEERRQRRLLPLAKLFPNMITLAALCCGLSAMRFALDERWELVVILLMASAILDGLDGRIARMLGASSTFGAQLDSLSDFVCFGVAPGFTLYIWALHDIKRYGWAAALLFAVCGALRLARFNTAMFDDKKNLHEPWRSQFFVGVPAPAGAMLALLPLVASFELEGGIFTHVRFNIAYLIVIALLMVSRVPTLSLKNIRIQHDMILSVMLAAALIIGCFIIEPWKSFLTCGFIYFATIPYTMLGFWKQKRLHASPKA